MKINMKMFINEWNLGKKDVCAWIYFCEFMSQSEKIILERKILNHESDKCNDSFFEISYIYERILN